MLWVPAVFTSISLVSHAIRYYTFRRNTCLLMRGVPAVFYETTLSHSPHARLLAFVGLTRTGVTISRYRMAAHLQRARNRVICRRYCWRSAVLRACCVRDTLRNFCSHHCRSSYTELDATPLFWNRIRLDVPIKEPLLSPCRYLECYLAVDIYRRSRGVLVQHAYILCCSYALYVTTTIFSARYASMLFDPDAIPVVWNHVPRRSSDKTCSLPHAPPVPSQR